MGIEAILVTGVIEVLKKLLIPVVVRKVGLSWSLKDDLRRLQETLEMILAKIADAEGKTEKNNEIRLWMKRLKDVAYDVDDVMDEFSYETMRRSERESMKYRASDFFSSSNPVAYRLKLTKKIKEINKRVDEIAKDMDRFQLQTTYNITDIAHGESSEPRSRQTASIIIGSEIVGRKDDKNKIVDILTKATTSSFSDVNQSSETVSVISIAGMGGLGKTTLAQLVYNDELVIKHFDQRIWVYVSIDFDVENILIKVMESITMAKFDNVSNFDLLVYKVQEKLQGKKFLLVLDDLWNANVLRWEKLESTLLVGAQGSRILITTRNIQVADAVKGTIRPYQLERLQEDECWSIMEKKAFSAGGALKTPNMTNIGKEIANRCCGLPLAAKFLGSLLHSKNKESDWLWIRETGIWNTQEGQSEIRPILKLSYDNLSPHLKQCFSCCSIFPKGLEIKRETLIHLWMAEGFLEPSSNAGYERSMEDIGEEYFDSLIWSSFLEGVKKNDLDDIITWKMHDLVHDLGRDAVGNRECAILKISELENISDDIRRLQLISDDDLLTRHSKALSELEKLRTIIVLEPNDYMEGYTFSSNEKLRVLHLGRMAEDCPGITYPAAKNLRHLRYFHLSNLNLINGALHDLSISKLYNLQTLILSGCNSVQNLLANMRYLKKLRFLDISSSDIKELPDSVTSLCNLQKLDLSHCKSLTTFPNSVTGLKYLRFLDMSFTPIEELPSFVINLCNLQTLDVSSCQKLKSLLEYAAQLANLRIFNFRTCPLLDALPRDFGALTQLRSLDLRGTMITVLPEACGNLYNLEYVNLFDCECLVQVKNWTKLRKFYYRRNMETPKGIEKLVWLQQLTYGVREQVINETDCSDGIEELANLNFLEILFIHHLQNVKDPIDAERANLKGKPNLRELYLQWSGIEEELRCDQFSYNGLNVFQALELPTSLGYLNIQNYLGRDLPTWMCVPSGLPNLVWLKLENCTEIKQLPAVTGQLPRLRTLTLEGMSFTSLDIGGFPSLIMLVLTDMLLLEELCYSFPTCLQDMWISGCPSLTEMPLFPSLRYLELEKVDHNLICSVGRNQTSLTTLFLKNIEKLIYFPISILQNNCWLQVLEIRECSQFRGFQVPHDENDFPKFHSGSIETLVLRDCPVLKFLHDLIEWTSLQQLGIFGCPQVKRSLSYDLTFLSFLKGLYVDFIQREEQQGDPSAYEDLINLMHTDRLMCGR